MNNKIKVFISALLAAGVVSLLWIVIPVTPTWIISYCFMMVAILTMALSFSAYSNKTTGIPQGHAFPLTAYSYLIINVVLSAVMIGVNFDKDNECFAHQWYAVIHAVILVIFIVRVISLTSGAGHIQKVGEESEQRHKELNKDKENYWKK